ncbi:MAG: hypothetical protein JXA14_16885 [Anaerolineae bacterium]|nr:hypothetical protein [Anaerolineae bacterium]
MATPEKYGYLIQDTLGRSFFTHLKALAEAWTEVVLDVTRERGNPLPFEFRFDWIRDAAMAAVELGLPMRPDPVLRLLSDRQYFASLLPLPADDPRWVSRSQSGTEMLWQWWHVYPDEYRASQLDFVHQVFQRLPDGAFRCLGLYDLANELP